MSNGVSQPIPPAGPGAVLRFAVQNPGHAPHSNLQDLHFLRSWLEYDSDIDDALPRRGINWYPVFGMLLVVAVSAGFWAGIGLMVTRFWK
jgi:hypothetical protein